MRAILSVYDKTGIVELGSALVQAGVELVSTGGTRAQLIEAGLPVVSVSDLTGFPEMMDGRVKTLHPAVHGGILARRDNSSDMEHLAEAGIGSVDLVAVNLYPFEETISRPGVELAEALENIDIGGPAMLRAAAKNFPSVVACSDPVDYEILSSQIRDGGPAAVPLEMRRRLAQKAFAHVSAYDNAIAGYLASDQQETELLPTRLEVSLSRESELRYGENPHQAGALYRTSGTGGIAGAKQLHGKALSFNNLLDADAAWRVVSDYSESAVAVIKHNNPCGLAVGNDQAETYRAAFSGDTVSAYGGIVGFNRRVTAAAAEAMRGVFYEVVVAPSYDDDALSILSSRKSLRILSVNPQAGPAFPDTRRISGGALVQTPDEDADEPTHWKTVSDRAPTASEMADLAFAWTAAKHVRSNAIVLARERTMVGMGAGQPNRLNSIPLAARAAGERARGSVLASDAFFPFDDNVALAAEAGVSAVIQPGGSIRDEDVVAAVNRFGMSMVFTGKRHFKH